MREEKHAIHPSQREHEAEVECKEREQQEMIFLLLQWNEERCNNDARCNEDACGSGPPGSGVCLELEISIFLSIRRFPSIVDAASSKRPEPYGATIFIGFTEIKFRDASVVNERVLQVIFKCDR